MTYIIVVFNNSPLYTKLPLIPCVKLFPNRVMFTTSFHCLSFTRWADNVNHVLHCCPAIGYLIVSWQIYSRKRLTRSPSVGYKTSPGACFSKVPKRFGPISGTTIPFISSQRRGSKPSNFAILLIFLILKVCKKISFSKRADCSLTTSFSGPKSSRDVRETGPWYLSNTVFDWRTR